MKTIHWFIVFVIIAGAAYYLVVGMGSTLRVSLVEQNASGQSGTAVFKEVGDKVEITLTVTGQPTDVAQPAHVHRGNCAEIGAVLVGLTFPKDGESTTTVLVSSLAELEAQGPLAVNVHKSGQESQKYVACGEVVF